MSNSQKPTRKPFFKLVKGVVKIFKKKVRIINLNEDLEDASVYLCNHSGAGGPLMLELYFPKDFRFWGTYEMCGKVKDRRKYLGEIYFPNKKHNSKFVSKLKAGILAPFSGMLYKGMQLIPTYPDYRMKNTVKLSEELMNKGQSILIFPEDSSDGYHDVLKSYYAGFYLLAKHYYKKFGKNVKIYNMYYKKKTNTLVIDKAVAIKDILDKNIPGKQVAEMFKDRANELGAMTEEELAEVLKNNN